MSNPVNQQAKAAYYNAFDIELKKLEDISNSRSQQGALSTAKMTKYLNDLNKQLHDVRILTDQLGPKFELFKKEIIALKARLAATENVIKDLQAKNIDLDKLNKRLIEEKQILETEKRDLEEKLKIPITEIDRLKEEVRRLTQDNERLQHENTELAGLINKKQRQIEDLTVENENLKRELQKVTDNLTLCETELQKLRTEKTDLEGQIKRLNLENEALITRIIRATTAIRVAVEKIQSVSPDNPANEKALSDLVQMATDSIVQISSAIQGIIRGGKKYKKSKKNKSRFTYRTTSSFRKKSKKSKKIKGGFTYRTTTSFRKKSKKSSSSLFNKPRKNYKKK